MTKTGLAMADDEIDVWLAMDPDSLRVLMQDREFQDGDFPPGLRGLNWEKRTGKISRETYDALLMPGFDGDENDRIHRELWTESGDTPWPGYV